MRSRTLARVASGVLAAAVLLSGLLPATAGAQAQPAPTELTDNRYFQETGFRIDNDKFWEYFQKRGGIGTFGYPVSREFELLGSRVQIFQRLILQVGPDGNPRTMNLLDEGLMPYTRINGSTYPAPDATFVQRTPSPADPDYGRRIIEFVREMAPDVWDGLNVAFWKTFSGTVSYQQAFPEGDGPESLLPLINLEIWGAPTSPPSYDPSNFEFAYQRFQRGIAHYRKSCDCTEGVLLGDYFKGILTGQDLPLDLETQAKSSPFYRQYSPTSVGSLARPTEMPGSDLTNAFSQQGPLVAGGQTPTRPPTVTPPPPVVAQPTPPPAAPVVPVAGVPYRAQSPEYGMNMFIWGHPNTTARDLGRLAELNFGWQKTLFQWREIEGACKGCFNWTEADRVVQASNARGVKVLARLDFQPKWASSAHNGPPDNYQDFADFVYALVDRYKTGSPHGRLHGIEVWNEVNLAREWGGKPINRAQAGDYVRLLKLGYAAAKRADPNVTVVTAGLSPTGWNDDTARPDTDYLQWLYDAGMKGHYDVLGAHGNTQAPAPEMEIGSWRGCDGGVRYCEDGSFYFRRIEQLRDIMVRNGDADKQIWVLEFGWTSDRIHPAYAWYAVSEEQKARNIVGAFQYARQNWAPWIGVMMLWTLPDPSWTREREESWWAIADPDGNPRPAYNTLLDARRGGLLP